MVNGYPFSLKDPGGVRNAILDKASANHLAKEELGLTWIFLSDVRVTSPTRENGCGLAPLSDPLHPPMSLVIFGFRRAVSAA